MWSRQGTGEKIPLKKTALSVTIQGIAPSLFGEMFKDPTLVKQMTEAYIPAWDEIEVRFNKTVIAINPCSLGRGQFCEYHVHDPRQ